MTALEIAERNFKNNFFKYKSKIDNYVPNARYREEFGELPVEEAKSIFLKKELERLNCLLGRFDKIKKFEDFLISIDAPVSYSNVSESRYYYWQGAKYRFSGHIYPTGSITSDTTNVVDLCAEPELIDGVVF